MLAPSSATNLTLGSLTLTWDLTRCINHSWKFVAFLFVFCDIVCGMGATLSSVPLCSRADPATDDNNNVDNLTDNNIDVEEVNQNVIVAQQPAPVETSTPKIDRERYISRTRQIKDK